MVVTMKDIAIAANVSSATVSKVVNGADQHISKNKREEILRLIEKMGYIPNPIARGLKNKHTKMIGFILPDITNPFFPEIERGIEDEAKKHGFGVVVCNTDNDAAEEARAFSFLESKMVDGIIFTHSVHESSMKFLDEARIPVVVVDRITRAKKDKCGQVYVDACAGIQTSTEYLIKKGCKKIGFISGGVLTTSDRYKGFKTALKKAHIHEYESLRYFGQYDMETGTKGAKMLLKSKTSFDGLVCGNDLIAIGALAVIEKHGLHIPDDVKVMGYDDIYLSHYVKPALSTVKQPAYEMGQKATQMIISHIVEGGKLSQEKLEFSVVLRESACY